MGSLARSAVPLFVCLHLVSEMLMVATSSNNYWSTLNLPASHMPFFFHSNEAMRQRCLAEGDSCPYKDAADASKASSSCWGYEATCDAKTRLSLVQCPGDSRGWKPIKSEQIDLFWQQGDFGFIKEALSEKRTYCAAPEQQKAAESGESSLLECTSHMRMCRARNIFFDFADLRAHQSTDRYREDIFRAGQVGVTASPCRLDQRLLKQNCDHKSPLQSWCAELQLFDPKAAISAAAKQCEVTFDEPTFVIKLDAGVNMYHHFCDFINLYVTQHANNSFMQDVQIVLWDTSGADYWSFFSDMWKVFSHKPPIHLRSFDGKKVCFRDATFSFLARMRFGLYYNMPLISGCHGTALFKAFNEHVLHRFGIEQSGPLAGDKIRVTLLARQTQYRNVLNQDELVAELRRRMGARVQLTVVAYDMKTPFVEQLRHTHNSDIFMSMHGAGLTHLLFLPEWAAVFEIYNCDDADCYLDLARLRGLKYFTWEDPKKVYPQDDGKHPQLGTPHKKFTNYSFDKSEFVRIVKRMVRYVSAHPAFIAARRAKYSGSSSSSSSGDEL